MKKMFVASVTTILLGGVASVQAADLTKGQQVHQQACFACHGTGAAGAPKTGDQAAWADRIGKGMDTLNEHAIKGFKGDKGFMPAKGGRSDLSDEDVQAAVAYMVEQSK